MRLRPGGFLALVIVAGCTKAPDLDEQLATVASWTATLHLAATEHRAHAITSNYATQLEDAARQVLAEARPSLSKSVHDDDDRRRAGAAVDSLERAIAALDAETRQ